MTTPDPALIDGEGICLAERDRTLRGDCTFRKSRCEVIWQCGGGKAQTPPVPKDIPLSQCPNGSSGYLIGTKYFIPPGRGCTFQGVRCEYENECRGGGGSTLSITKTCEPRTVTAGMPVTCTITVRNTGNRPETFQITEQLPSGMEFLSATPPGWVSVQNGQLIIQGSVGANSSVQIAVVVMVTGHGPLTNSVLLTTGGGQPPAECRKKEGCPGDGGSGSSGQASDTVTSRGRPSTVGTAFIAASALRTGGSSAASPRVPKGILLVDSETNRLLVYLSRGDGTFRRFKTYTTGQGPVDVKAGDFDGDGKTDAVVVNSMSDSITIFFGNGDGTFRKAREVQLPGTKPVAVALTDFDRDGALDLAIAQQGSADLAILLGRGDGTFRLLATIPLFDGKPSSVSIADWNLDGSPDLIVTAIVTNEVVFFRGDGRGHFSEAGRRAVGEYPVASATGDFDRDGQMDIAVANLLSDSITLLLSQGKSRSLGFTRVDVESVEQPTFVISGEFFKGMAGVAAPNFTANTVTFISFEQGRPRTVRRLRAIAEPVSLGLGDFNDDGLLDVVVAGLPVGSLGTLVGRENGTFALKR
ncbi:MAG: FG-GAP-like repeat-containing protein [Acidobacteriota bacterium]|nr:FG-GAP-like repeat-containing protein [Acidobacteriota bacterium]